MTTMGHPADVPTTRKGSGEATLAGTAALARLGLRRERYTLPAWLTATVGVSVATSAVYAHAFPGSEGRVIATLGRTITTVTGVPGGVLGAAVVANEIVLLPTTFAALMAVFAVLRQTRRSEETGRADLLASLPVGRRASLAAALIIAVAACAALIPLLGLALVVSGLPVEGSFAFAASVAGFGMMYGGVATMTAQLWESVRASTADAVLVIGLVYLFRPLGTVAEIPWPAWFSPLGWAQQVQAFEVNRWIMLLPLAGLLMGTAALGFILNNSRDLGTGTISSRKRARAPGHVDQFTSAREDHHGSRRRRGRPDGADAGR